MSSLEAKFRQAVSLVQSLPEGSNGPSNSDKLRFYALFKQATHGRNDTPKPKMLDLVAKAKWDAWSKLGNMSKEEAMKQYIDSLLEMAKNFPPSADRDKIINTLTAPAPAKTAAASTTSTQEGGVTIYGSLASQPTRAVVWFCLLNNIPHNMKLIKVEAGEHLSPEYAKINPARKIPAIDDGGFLLSESHAILRYLAAKYKVNDHWFPADIQKRARVDEYLDWHHSNLRKGAAGLFFSKVLAPRIGKNISEEHLNDVSKTLHLSLKHIENHFLKRNTYIAGDQPSIADLSAACELLQLKVIQYDLSAFPNINKWLSNLQKLPHFQHVNRVIDKMASKM